MNLTKQPCPDCKGDGFQIDEIECVSDCDTCNGEGSIYVEVDEENELITPKS